HFYILLPLVFLLFRGFRPRLTSLFIFVLFFFIPLVVRGLTWPNEAGPKDDLAFLMYRFPCALDYFAWGVLFAGFFISCPSPTIGFRRLGYVGYAGVVLLAITIGLHMFWDSRYHINTKPARWSVEAFHYLPEISCFLLLFFLFDPGCA